MTSTLILLFLKNIGAKFSEPQAHLAQDYFNRMIKDGRVIAINKDGELHGILAFSLCFDYVPYWKKETWEYKQHEPNGTTLYIEFLAALNWNKEARQTFAQEILKRYPQIEQAVWHKWAHWGDRKVIWRKQWAMK